MAEIQLTLTQIQTNLQTITNNQQILIKHINFQYTGANVIDISQGVLTIGTANFLGKISLAQFPNLISIVFEGSNNLNFAHFESIDISENTNLARIMSRRQANNANLSCYPWQISAPSHGKKNKFLKDQTAIPYCLVEDKKAEQLQVEVEKLSQTLIEKSQQIEDLKKKTEQTPTLEQFQELNNKANIPSQNQY
ncbi:13968_t:CDS:2 [Entrophospora sp. SA101]|nr:13968_t:CDS:2 [Entrophospora sp. SA101]